MIVREVICVPSGVRTDFRQSRPRCEQVCGPSHSLCDLWLQRSAVPQPPPPFSFEATFSLSKLFDIHIIPSDHVLAVTAAGLLTLGAGGGLFVSLLTESQSLMFSLTLSAVVPFLVEKGILVAVLHLDHTFALLPSTIQLWSVRGLRA